MDAWTFGKEKARQARKEEVALQNKLAATQITLERDPQGCTLQSTLAEVEALLQEYSNNKTKWMMDTMQRKWLQTEGSCTRSHFVLILGNNLFQMK